MYVKLVNKLGECELEVQSGTWSSCDAYVASGYSIDLDRDLTEEECEELTELLSDSIQEYVVEHLDLTWE